jgi:hypothetical protein
MDASQCDVECEVGQMRGDKGMLIASGALFVLTSKIFFRIKEGLIYSRFRAAINWNP